MDRNSLWWDFYGVQLTLEGWQKYLTDWATTLDGVWLLGTYMAAPIRQTTQWVIYGKYKIWLIYDAIIWVLDSSPLVPTLDSIRDWLRGQWGELDDLLKDATDWVGRRVPRAYSTSSYIHQSFYYWFSDWLFRDARPLYNLLVDPGGTVRDLVRFRFPNLASFEDSWKAFLDDRIPKAYIWGAGLATSPKDWLDNWLMREFWDLWYAKTNFPQWFKTQLASHLPDVYDLLFATSTELEELLRTKYGRAMDALRAPGDYLRDTWFSYYPESSALLAAPATYIWCKLKEYLDTFVEAERTWIQRIASRVLSALW